LIKHKLIKYYFEEFEKIKLGKFLEKKILPSKEEIKENSRSKSAVMRIFEYRVKSSKKEDEDKIIN